jgi:hypothetical protein
MKMKLLHAEMTKGAKTFDSKHGNFTLRLNPEEIYDKLMGAQEQDTVRLFRL